MTEPINRREFIACAAGALAACTLRANPFKDHAHTLREVAGRKGLLYGAAIRDASAKDPQSAELFAQQCSILVPEGALKWDTLRPAPDRFDFSAGDADLRFAEENNMQYRGHNLCWHEALPPWFQSTVNASNARKYLVDHISTVAGRYAGKLHSWDVVNEITEVKDGQPQGLRNTPWLRLLGPEYIEIAFHAAREADPHALLVYNEDQLEPDTYHAEAKRQSVLALLQDLLAKNVPIQALGIESHIFGEAVVGGRNFCDFLKAVEDLGLFILVTEMDVIDQNILGDVAHRDSQVASTYHNYLSAVLQYSRVAAVLTWGLSDRYTWLAQHNPRPDGEPVRPLPFDANFEPTKAKEAITRAFSEAPDRPGPVRKLNHLSPSPTQFHQNT